jgi:hypothetical protein
VALGEVALALGSEEGAIELSGDARLEPWPGGRLTATLRAARLDLDRAARSGAPPKPWVAIAPLFAALALGDGLPFAGSATVSIDSIAAGGGVVRDLRAELSLNDGALAVERVEARLPGRGLVRARGSARGAAFTGDVAIEAEEPAALFRWIAGAGKAVADDAGVFKFTAKLNASAGGLSIDQISAALGPAQIKGRVRYAAASKPERLEFEMNVTQPDALAPLVETFAETGDLSALLQRFVGSAPSLQLSGTIGVEAGGFAAEATMRTGLLQVDLRGRFDLSGALSDEARVVVDAREGARLLTLIGLPPGRITGAGRIEATLKKLKDGAFAMSGQLVTATASVAGVGEVRIAGGRLEPALDLTLEASDLRALSPIVERAVEHALPASGTARFGRQSEGIALDDLALKVGEARIKGRLDIKVLDPPAFAGTLTIDRTELSTLLGLALGRASGAGFWPDTPLSPAALAGANGALELSVGTLPLAGPLIATDARLQLRISSTNTAISGFAADLAGGKLAGEARVTRGEGLALDLRLALAKADAARLASDKLRGRADLTLLLTGQGRTPAALAASLAGQGVLLVDAPEIEGLDPGTLAAILAMSGPPPDEARMAALVTEALARGPLKLDRIEAAILVASGVARATKVRAAVGPVQVGLEGGVDLARLNLDAAVELEALPPAGASLKPALTVRWRGPLAAPERRIDASPLATVLALRAMERATIEAGAPPAPVAAPPPARVPTPKKKPAPQSTIAPALPPPLDIRPAPGAGRQTPPARVLQ